MNSHVRNGLGLVAGIIAGSAVNLALVNIGPAVVPLPAGVDISTMEGLRESMKLFAPANFLFPFLGHALGTLVGAYVAARLAATHRRWLALGIGAFFLCGGLMMVVQCGGPAWFIAADLLLAYLPMGYLGGVLAGGRQTVSR